MNASPERGVSVVIITKNERRNLPQCLQSVRFADEVMVVDDFSSDGTPEVARAAGARVIARAWEGYAAQRQHGITAATREWILWLDADERVTPALKDEIEAVLREDGHGRDAYLIPRRHLFLGEWLRHGGEYPALQLRLVRRNKAVLRQVLVHESIEDAGLDVGWLTNPIDHLSSPRLSTRITKARRYARLAAAEVARSGRVSELSVTRLLTNPLRRMAYVFLKAGGYRDGWRGAAWAVICGLEQALFAVHIVRLRASGLHRRGEAE
jgi:(heptosyl)LPS beta-1,4-glucosyltransferase